MRLGFSMDTGFELNRAFQHLLERAFSLMIAYDPVMAEQLRTFDGFTLKIFCSSPAMTGFVVIRDRQSHLLSHTECQPDAELQGTLGNFLSLLGKLSTVSSRRTELGQTRFDDTLPVTYPSGMSVSGNEQKLQLLLRLIKWSEPDWESALSGYIPPLAAHGFGQGFRSAFKFVRQQVKHSTLNFSEYLQEERVMLPSVDTVLQFKQSVHDLQQQVSSLEERIKRLSVKNIG